MNTQSMRGTYTTVSARKLNQHIKLKQLEQAAKLVTFQTKHLSDTLLIFDASSLYVCFSRGIVVQWAPTPAPLPECITQLNTVAEEEPQPTFVEETYRITFGSPFSIDDGLITLDDDSIEVLATISHALARSVQIEHDERAIDALLSEMKRVPQQLQKTGRVKGRNTEIRKMIGAVLQAKHNISTFGIADDRPELLWEDDSLRGYYREVSQDLELHDRREVLNEKISFLEDMLAILRDEIHTKHGHFLEWAIVLLIIFEIALFFLEKSH